MQSQQRLNGRYRLESQLGTGGSSVVWKARDEVLDRWVAVKILDGPHATDPAARLRIRAEAQAAAGLWHPHVTNVYDYGEESDGSRQRTPYVVMEFLPGHTLAERLAADPLPVRTALRVCAEVASALAAAHAQHLVHRDVKPSNVMLTPSGAKVLDFGIAAVAGRPELESDGLLLGTPAYLAPERLTGDEVLPASDVYALGLLIHRALTNHLPWQAETTTQMLASHMYVEPSPLPVIEGVPARVNEVCDRCLEKNPADRPSADEVATILAEAADSPATDPSAARDPAATGALRRRRVLTLLSAAALVATISLTAIFVDFRAQPDAAGSKPSRSGTGQSATGSLDGDDASVDSIGAAGSPEPTTTAEPGTSGGSESAPPGRGSRVQPGSGTTVTPPGGVTSPSPSRSDAAPVPPGTSISARGGVVRVRCAGKAVEVLGVEPAPGYTIKDYDPGPANEIQVVLLSATNESEVKVRCPNGAPMPRVKESPQ